MWKNTAGFLAFMASFLDLGGMNHSIQSDAPPTPSTDPTAEESPDREHIFRDTLRLILPTSNAALLDDDGPAFYQYTDRNFEGQRSRPWQGGKYGFVRNPYVSSGEMIYTRFHEGVDIRPLYRNSAGEPLDTVRTIDDGVVVYVNDRERASSYGKYVVVEHIWSNSPFYSLYAHLGRIDVRQNQRVSQGDRLGRVGYTGRGINRRRAHLHFEVNMLLNGDYDRWHAATYRAGNLHGIHNGINLAGLDVAELYRELNINPDLTIEEFVRGKAVFYGVIVPNYSMPDLLMRYPWLMEDGAPAAEEAPAWEFRFTASGFPVAVNRAYRTVEEPVVSMVVDVPHSYDRMTIGRVTGSRGEALLSTSGRRYMSLIAPRHDRSRTGYTGP